jgi:Oxidoreductase family, NAD-binding Rossmann fold
MDPLAQVGNDESVSLADATISRRDILRLSGAAAASIAAGMTLSVGRAYPVENSKKIRMGVVGGNFGSAFFWHQHPNCVVTGVTDLLPDRRKRLQTVYQCDTAYDSLEQMVQKANDIDAVAVFSGAPDHVQHATLCLDRGWHVISAVPACFSLEEAERLKNKVEKTGLTYMMAETSHYAQSCIFARELYGKEVFGNLFYTEAEYYHDRGDLDRLANDKASRFFMQDGSHSWRWGLPPMHYPTHATGLLVGVTRERITKASCVGWGTGDHPFITDNVYKNPFWNESSIMQTNRGNILRCNVFWLCPAHGERAQWMGDDAIFYMNKGGVHGPMLKYRTEGKTATQFDLPVQSGGEVDVPVYWKTDMLPPAMRHDSGHGGSHAFITAEFINALVEERSPAVDVYEALAMTVPGIVAHQSALKGGEQLTVPQFDKMAAK